MLKNLLIIYAMIALTTTIGGSIISLFETEYERNIFIVAFYPQIETVRSLCYELNMAGLIIVLVVETVFLLPCNVILLIAKIIEYAVTGAWALFKKVFKRKEEGE